MFLLLKQCDFELVMHLDGGVVQGNIVLENFGNRWLLEDRLPWALRLARAAIDALVRVDVELIRKFFSVVTSIFVNAVDRTNTDASCIETVSAKTGYGPGHLVLYFRTKSSAALGRGLIPRAVHRSKLKNYCGTSP
jgi:hypothetical protein